MPNDHVVHFYDDDAELGEAVGRYLGEGLASDAAAVVVATADHVAAVDAVLTRTGIDPEAARSEGRLVTLDAAETLARFAADGTLDPGAFDAVIGGILREAVARHGSVRVYGEMVALLWDAGDVPGAIELEMLWNELGLRVPFSLFCAYPQQSVRGELHAGALARVCQLHSEVLDREALESAHFVADLDAPRGARHFVAETLERWGLGALVPDASLVVTELATNAVLHARSALVVTVSSCGDKGVRVAVRDDNSLTPTVLTPSPTATTGRGLLLIEAIAARWGSEPDGEGKVVWAEL